MSRHSKSSSGQKFLDPKSVWMKIFSTLIFLDPNVLNPDFYILGAKCLRTNEVTNFGFLDFFLRTNEVTNFGFWILDLETKMHLRLEFDSGVGPTC